MSVNIRYVTLMNRQMNTHTDTLNTSNRGRLYFYTKDI